MLVTFYRTNEEAAPYYYAVHDRQGNLFAKYSLTVTWGSELSAGREKVYTFSSRSELDAKLREIIDERLRDGYRVLYSYFRRGERRTLRARIRRASAS
jgi:predicted DNA-binding WGR domain protein